MRRAETQSHGKNRSAYIGGCRCDECVEANKAYQRAYRSTIKRGNLPAEPIFALFEHCDDKDLRELLRISLGTLRSWRTRGVTLSQADQIATTVGLHPYSLWGDAYWTAEMR